MLIDQTGALYGTTYFGGVPSCDCGTVYKLTPPGPGRTNWTEIILHSFTFAEGRAPMQLVADA